MSLPSWERGLKFTVFTLYFSLALVAPLVGAWIEIKNRGVDTAESGVAPLVGAWIEIFDGTYVLFPSRVAPLVGAWIEICARDDR